MVALRHPWAVFVAATVLIFATLWPASQLGTEFMPELDEGDFLYMPPNTPHAVKATTQFSMLLTLFKPGGVI